MNDRTWSTLLKAGGIAALLSAILFRRNIGAEVSLFTGVEAIPRTVAGWYALLQSRPLLGLSFLAVFDLADYALVGLMFLALYAALWSSQKVLAIIALASGLVGVTVYFATNIALTMLSLSEQYATAATEAERAALLTAGRGVLAFNNPLAVYPSTGAYMSVLLIAVASLVFSVAMLRTRSFGVATGSVGIIAAVCDLAYCLTFAIAPGLRTLLLATAGLFWMVWHLLVGIKLLRLSRTEKNRESLAQSSSRLQPS